jgi:diadenosine tetraphosphate (Ap4A) HIT family hydrolase
VLQEKKGWAMRDLGSQRQNDVHGNQIVMHLHMCVVGLREGGD